MKILQYLFITLMFIGYGTELAAQADTPDRNISDFIDASGHLQNPEGYSGRLDMSGFELEKDSNGQPIFRPASTGHPDNEFWTHPEVIIEGFQGIVRALVIHGDNLFIGGSIESIGDMPVNNIARFNISESKWYDMGEGVTAQYVSWVNSLAISGDNLYVGGDFTMAGGEQAINIARYDINESSWHNLSEKFDRRVDALKGIDDMLFVSGAFYNEAGTVQTRIARYNTSDASWDIITDSISGAVFAFAVKDNQLYVGGSFTIINGQLMRGVARYNMNSGIWISIGNVYGTVRALTIYNDMLFVGGTLSGAVDIDAENIIMLNLSNGEWEALGPGVNYHVHSVLVDDDDLYVVGGRSTTSPGPVSPYVSKFNITTNTWQNSDFQVDDEVYAIIEKDGYLYIGGYFGIAGGILSPGLASINKETLIGKPLFSVSEFFLNGSTQDLVVHGNDIYIGGQFTFAGDKAVNHIVRYNIIDGTWHRLGDGVNRPVRTLALSGDNLYVGGIFTEAGGEPANRIARYNISSGSWHQLGDGVDMGLFGGVSVIKVNGTDVFVGGEFDEAGGIATGHIARFDIAEEVWHSLDSGISNGTVRAIAIHNNNLYVGGRFTNAGGQPVNNIARYNFSTNNWYPLKDGVYFGLRGRPNMVETIVVNGDDLFVGGNFRYADGKRVRSLARYDTNKETWHSVNWGVEGNVSALAVKGDELYVGGNFNISGIEYVQSVAAYHLTAESWHTLGNGIRFSVSGFAFWDDDLLLSGSIFEAGGRAASNFARWSGPRFNSITEEGDLPESIYLAQNYPNPFNPTTKIEFTLSEPSDVRIEVFNMTGQRIAILEDGYQNVGTHSVTFEASRLSSGVYLYRLIAGSVVETRKMVLIK